MDNEPRLLSEATVQEIQLELIRRTRHNACEGARIVEALRQHPELWEAAMMDRFCFSNPTGLPSLGLLKLRDLPHNDWNVGTLYVLTPDAASARQFAEIAEGWGGMVQVHDDEDEVDRALGGRRGRHAIVSVWWD